MPRTTEDVKAVWTSRLVSSWRCTTAWPTPIWAKYWPKRSSTIAMATSPNSAGVSRRARTAVTAICRPALMNVEA